VRLTTGVTAANSGESEPSLLFFMLGSHVHARTQRRFVAMIEKHYGAVRVLADDIDQRIGARVQTGNLPRTFPLTSPDAANLRTRKPLWHKGFRGERATGVEPATSSLGSVESGLSEVRGNQRQDRNFSRLQGFCLFPRCPEKARLVTKKPEPFRVEVEAGEGVSTH
jgi:hypothetical protein